MSATATALAGFVRTNTEFSSLYYAYVGWPYLLVGFLIGSIPMGLLVGKLFFRSDIRENGSGNIGAANALRSYGRGAGIAVFVLDLLKGAAVIAIARFLVLRPFSPPFLPHAYNYGDTVFSLAIALMPLAGLAAILGHCFSPWLRFRGGKGVATYFGILITVGLVYPRAVSLVAALIFAIVWGLTIARTSYSSLASLLAVTATTIWIVVRNIPYAIVGDGNCYLLFALASLAVIAFRHRANIERLRDGRETRLSFARGAQGPPVAGG